VAAPHRIARAEAAEEIDGDWRVMCEKGAYNAYQIRTGSPRPSSRR
jgi:hypothetical protein